MAVSDTVIRIENRVQAILTTTTATIPMIGGQGAGAAFMVHRETAAMVFETTVRAIADLLSLEIVVAEDVESGPGLLRVVPQNLGAVAQGARGQRVDTTSATRVDHANTAHREETLGIPEFYRPAARRKGATQSVARTSLVGIYVQPVCRTQEISLRRGQQRGPRRRQPHRTPRKCSQLRHNLATRTYLVAPKRRRPMEVAWISLISLPLTGLPQSRGKR
jgi:hypothetical protein